MKNLSSLILTSAFFLLGVPVIAGQLQTSATDENVTVGSEVTCPSGYSEKPSYRWDKESHRFVFEGWVCQPNGGYGP